MDDGWMNGCMNGWVDERKEELIGEWLCRCDRENVHQIYLKAWNPLKGNSFACSEEVANDFVIKQKEVEIENSQKRKLFFSLKKFGLQRNCRNNRRIRAQEVMLFLPRLVEQRGRNQAGVNHRSRKVSKSPNHGEGFWYSSLDCPESSTMAGTQ